MSQAYSEDQLVEQPAIGLFSALGWQTVSAMEETFGAGGTLSRETKGEVVLVERLRAALCKFNPALPPEAISNAVDELTRDRSAMSLEAANREVYRLLKEGITVSVPDREHGGQKTERLRVVDWETPAHNDFLLVSQFSVTGALYTCRPDLVGFVNGLPWVVIELKKPGVPARAAFDEMRNHTLMQTIARANRVFPGKHSGVIVDYANVFASLEKALAIYGAGKDGKSPVKDKQQLVEELRKAVGEATAFCAVHGVMLAEIEALAACSLERLQHIEDAMNALISPDPLRRDFFAHERMVSTLYGAVKPDPWALEFASRVACLSTLAEAIRAKLNPNPPDISRVMGEINGLLDESITGHEIRESGPAALDLSKINFEALAQRFKESRHKNTDLEVLKAAIRAQLERMIQLNRTRTDFAEKFEALIESYNAGSRSIEELYDELVKISNSLSEEQERHVRENMSEEELVIFDILTRPAPELSGEERTEVKKVARDLLARLKELLVLNWRQKQQARARLTEAIKATLDDGLPRAYTPELYNQKCSAVFEHVYESYPERNAGVYA
jgi:type I site-specific restriction-modification system R (restriction) subunit